MGISVDVDNGRRSKSEVRDDLEKGGFFVSPFGAYSKNAARIPFTERSFGALIWPKEEREKFGKRAAEFMDNPPDSPLTVKQAVMLSRGWFLPWAKPCFSEGSLLRALEPLCSGAAKYWAANLEAVPDFVRAVELLKKKYSQSLGSPKIMDALQRAIEAALLFAKDVQEEQQKELANPQVTPMNQIGQTKTEPVETMASVRRGRLGGSVWSSKRKRRGEVATARHPAGFKAKVAGSGSC